MYACPSAAPADGAVARNGGRAGASSIPPATTGHEGTAGARRGHDLALLGAGERAGQPYWLATVYDPYLPPAAAASVFSCCRAFSKASSMLKLAGF